MKTKPSKRRLSIFLQDALDYNKRIFAEGMKIIEESTQDLKESRRELTPVINHYKRCD